MNTQPTLRIAALAFTALYALAFFLPVLPEGSDPDDRVLGLVNADTAPIVLGGYALAGAGLVFLWWLSALAHRFPDDRSPLSRILLTGGTAYAVLLMLASCLFSTIALGIGIGELPLAEDAFLVRVVSNLGFHVVLVPALLCASLVVLAATLLARRASALPAWCVGLGLLVVPLLWLGPLWVPQFLVPLWTVAISFALRRRMDGPGPARTASAPVPSRARVAS